MAVRKMQLKDWNAMHDRGATADLVDFDSGPSPGGAASELGISRQAVHAAIKRGDLDVLAIYDGRRLSHYTISKSSLGAYKDLLRERATRDLQRIARRLA